MTVQQIVRHVSIVSFQRSPAVNIPTVINIMGNVVVRRGLEGTTVLLQCAVLSQMDKTDRCDKATTATVRMDGLESTAMSAQITRPVID